MIERDVWLALAARLAEIRAARAAAREDEAEVHLEFDAHDQATVVNGSRH
jgi:hypothetical protein